MPTLSKFPKGFLSLVGLLSEGQNPRTMAETIVPTVDIGTNYLLETQEGIFGVNAAGAAGFNVFAAVDLVVPVGEVWRVWSYAVTVVSAAGQTGRIGPSIRLGPASGPRFPTGAPINYVASETNWVMSTQHPTFLLPGYQLGFEMAQVVGGAPTVVSGALIFSRLRA